MVLKSNCNLSICFVARHCRTSYKEFPFPSTTSVSIEFESGEPLSHGVNLGVVHGEVVLDADVVLSPEVDLVPHFPYNPLLVVVVVALWGIAYVMSAKKGKTM